MCIATESLLLFHNAFLSLKLSLSSPRPPHLPLPNFMIFAGDRRLQSCQHSPLLDILDWGHPGENAVLWDPRSRGKASTSSPFSERDSWVIPPNQNYVLATQYIFVERHSCNNNTLSPQHSGLLFPKPETVCIFLQGIAEANQLQSLK